MILLTGAAGFIGFHVGRALLDRGETVVGIDNLNDYYDPALKQARLEMLRGNSAFEFQLLDICDFGGLERVFARFKPERVCHLAAQAGVRYSLTNPFAYQKANNEGFLNIIELAKRNAVANFVYASSSSVYGMNTKLPFAETDPVDQPMSLYAATKRSNELTAFCYNHLFGIPTSGLRFFTVYGPWGRPDMALFVFTRAILGGDTIDVYNEGNMLRNFTYVDDVVNGVLRTIDTPRPCEIYNLGNSRAENLMDFIREIERVTGKKAKIRYCPMQPGDVPATRADITRIRALGFEPATNIDQGIRKFVEWFRAFYKM